MDEHINKILEREMQCDYCDDRFDDVLMAVHHYELTHSRMDVRCLKCNCMFPSVGELLNRCDTVDTPCPKCLHCSCICGPPSDEEYEYSEFFDENDFITKFMK